MRLRDAVVEGWRITLGVSALASIWVLVGHWLTGGRNLERIGLSLGTVLGGYLVAGMITGVVYGATRSWRFRLFGRVASGVAVGLCVGLTIAFTIPPEGEGWSERAFIGVVYGLVIGGAWGVVWMRSPTDDQS